MVQLGEVRKLSVWGYSPLRKAFWNAARLLQEIPPLNKARKRTLSVCLQDERVRWQAFAEFCELGRSLAALVRECHAPRRTTHDGTTIQLCAEAFMDVFILIAAIYLEAIEKAVHERRER